MLFSLCFLFLASPDAQEVMWVSQSVTHSLTPVLPTWLMWPWWVMIPLADFTDEDDDKDDEDDEDDYDVDDEVTLTSPSEMM